MLELLPSDASMRCQETLSNVCADAVSIFIIICGLRWIYIILFVRLVFILNLPVTKSYRHTQRRYVLKRVRQSIVFDSSNLSEEIGNIKSKCQYQLKWINFVHKTIYIYLIHTYTQTDIHILYTYKDVYYLINRYICFQTCSLYLGASVVSRAAWLNACKPSSSMSICLSPSVRSSVTSFSLCEFFKSVNFFRLITYRSDVHARTRSEVRCQGHRCQNPI